MRAVVQVLAEIKLNLASVDQFIAIACGLADDNAEIKEQIYAAAKLARSSALLIDHLRNLFSHQQSVEAQQAELRQQAEYKQQQQQHYQQRQWRQQQAASGFPPTVQLANSVSQRCWQLEQNSHIFTYSNQQTLVRAAKCLVANVAKILYLTDSVALQAGVPLAGPISKQTAAGAGGCNAMPAALSERLDNVANYSQLLRFFGELSGELVDLGQCIMLSESQSAKLALHNQQRGRPFASLPGARPPPLPPTLRYLDSAEPERMRPLEQASADWSSRRRYADLRWPQGNAVQLAGSAIRPSASSNSQLASFLHHNSNLSASGQDELEYRSRQRRRRSELGISELAEAQTEEDPAALLFGVPNQVNPDETADGVGALEKGPLELASFEPPGAKHPHDKRLEAKIQNMQILFQANRIIIDRSILLLLSASKCCLRQGEECQRGLEARRSIVLQIRASVSIIMAVVKCSVFQPQIEPQRAGELGLPLLTEPTAVTCVGHICALGQRDNQFDCHCSAAATAATCQSAFSAEEAFLALGRGLARSTWPSSDEQRRQSITSANGNANSRGPNCAANNMGARLARTTTPEMNLEEAGESPLQIMNYFLQTWNGTQSAHNTINKLLLLVEPFTLVTDYKCLVGTLNELLQQHCHRSNNSASGLGGSLAESPELQADDKENELTYLPGERVSRRSRAGNNHFMLMNKRQLVNALNSIFLGELRANLVERCHEFTDCPYTSNEHRETVLLLLHCIKLLLNKLVKLIYRLRRNVSAIDEANLRQLRQLAGQLEESLAELNNELQTVVIEQSDELDRCNNKLDLFKQLKHHCLAGDLAKTKKTCDLFREQCDQLVENCKMLNQVAQTNKLKISSKTLAIWFELNLEQLLSFAQCLSESPRSRALKDSTWAYLQVWCSFYDDFCQLARQTAYLAHLQYDPDRSNRVATFREQLLMRRRLSALAGNEPADRSEYMSRELSGTTSRPLVDSAGFQLADANPPAMLHQHQRRLRGDIPLRCASDPIDRCAAARELMGADVEDIDDDEEVELLAAMAASNQQGSGQSAHRNSVQSVDIGNELAGSISDITDSPRSLDHYYGFGANYHRRSRAYSQQAHHQQHPAQLDPSPPIAYSLHQAPFSAQPNPSPLDKRLHMRRQVQENQQQQLPGQPLDYELQSARHHYGKQAMFPAVQRIQEPSEFLDGEPALQPPVPPARRPVVTIGGPLEPTFEQEQRGLHQATGRQSLPAQVPDRPPGAPVGDRCPPPPPPPPPRTTGRQPTGAAPARQSLANEVVVEELAEEVAGAANTDQQSSSATEQDKWSDSDADAIVRGAKETAQMALSMYQFTRGEGDLNTTQDLFTQAELFAEESNELYKEVRCFSYKVPAGDLKRELLSQLSVIPALVQQLQFIVKNPTVGKPATFAKVDSVIRETRSLMEAVNRVVTATLSCRQHYNMAIASMRKRTRTLSPSYRADKGFEFESHSAGRQSALQAGRHGAGGGGGMGSESDI